MISNLERYRNDLKVLSDKADLLFNSIQMDCHPTEFKKAAEEELGDKAEFFLKNLPSFKDEYQSWYSESKALIRQLLPDRLSDFERLYEKPKSRKVLLFENYRIEDYLQGLAVTRGPSKEKVVGPDAAIPHFRQQVAILKAVKSRFESSLFDIQSLVQADLFDSELEAAAELAKKKFTRAAGALAGVVLEKLLHQVCSNHSVNISKKNPTISDFNDSLKTAEVVDTPTWRFIQHLGDIRNLCDHSKRVEPTADQISDLIDGVSKISKSLF